MERSVVLIKPDGVMRGIIGQIITRFERVGLKIIAMKMVWVSKEMAGKHYPDSRIEFLKGMGQKSLDNYKEYGMDPVKEMGSADPLEIGKMVNTWLKEYLTSGPVIAMLIEGNHAIAVIRRIVGHTLPAMAASGTIRGDFSIDSSALANARRRPIRNLIHASGNLEEEKIEEELWFDPKEVHSYKRADEDAMF